MFIKIFTTGGTIDKVYFDALSEFQIGDPQIGDVLQYANVTFDFEVVPLMRKDSLKMTDEDRDIIFKAVELDPCPQIVITHGTDTMTHTASYLRAILDKTIVFTGSLQPARFHQTDAIFNIACAVTAAQTMPPGLYIAMNGQVFDALKVRKNRTANRFEEIT